MSRLFAYILAWEEHAPYLGDFLNGAAHNQPITEDLLNASLYYRVVATPLPPDAPPPGGMPAMPMPPPPAEPEATESLIVPIFQRDRFVVGDLYGRVSPNALALQIMSQGSPPPAQLCRRFCVDLSVSDAIEFVEYEHFSDGKLIVSMHTIDLDGDYGGHSIVLGAGALGAGGRAGGDPGLSHPPPRVLMRMQFSETVDCDTCGSSRAACACDGPQSARVTLPTARDGSSRISWSNWLSAFAKTRTGASTMKISFSIVTPAGDVRGTANFRLEQDCEEGEEGGRALLLRQYQDAVANEPPSARGGLLDDSDVATSAMIEEMVHEMADYFPDVVLQSLDDGGAMTSACTEAAPVSRDAGGAPAGSAPTPPPPPPASRSSVSRQSGVAAGGARAKVFTCEHCSTQFSHKGHLNVHIMTKHLKLRPHACPQCSSTFAKRSDLRRHARAVHKMDDLGDGGDAEAPENRPYACDDCERRYATRQGLRKHRVTKHSERAPSPERDLPRDDGAQAPTFP
jgi:hypothetical protein